MASLATSDPIETVPAPGGTLRAISMWQPVPALLCSVLTVETRSWRTTPGPIALHAGKSRKGLVWSELPLWRKVMDEHGLRAAELPRGCVVGVADIAEVVSTDDWQPPSDTLEASMLDFGPGRWAFSAGPVRGWPSNVPAAR
jgi:hypothetical protein